MQAQFSDVVDICDALQADLFLQLLDQPIFRAVPLKQDVGPGRFWRDEAGRVRRANLFLGSIRRYIDLHEDLSPFEIQKR